MQNIIRHNYATRREMQCTFWIKKLSSESWGEFSKEMYDLFNKAALKITMFQRIRSHIVDKPSCFCKVRDDFFYKLCGIITAIINILSKKYVTE